MKTLSCSEYQESSTSEIARLRRAVDRYKAVGLQQRAEAPGQKIEKLFTRKLTSFGGLRDPLAYRHYQSLTSSRQFDQPSIPPGLHRAESTVERYIGCDDLCVISCFFNPCGYLSRVRNFRAFVASLVRSNGVHWRSIECAFGHASHMLPNSEHILRVRSNSILWQKERMLNRLVSALPDSFTKIAWVDADVLFTSPTWIVDASDALNDSPVIQLFTSLARFDDRIGSSEVDILESFASLYQLDPDGALGPTYFQHGHTGLAWAGRRDWIERFGLYDCCLSGTGDHLMAHAFVGDWQPDCIGVGQGPAYFHFVQWCERVYPSLRARLGVVPGQVISLWHGPESARDYYGAVCSIRDSGFDPLNDLCLNNDGCWEWSSDKPDLHRWAYEYFFKRQEDG